MTNIPLEEYAAALEASDDYRVLRRLKARTEFEPDDGPVKVGVILDCETLGTDPERDEIIELGMVRFTFGADGKVHRVTGTFDQFRQPLAGEISPEITALTGITDEMVAGQTIEPEAVERFVEDAAIIIAHHSDFDRRFVEKLFPIFARKCWACSYKEIDWKSEGRPSARLGDLLGGLGLFHTGHRADSDALALLELLSRPLPKSGRPALGALLDEARKPTVQIIVENARRAGDYLKFRGFRWHDGADGSPKSWRLETSEFNAKLEVGLIAEDYPTAQVAIKWVTAFDRFSGRI